MRLTVKQAASLAGVSQSLVYEWCAERRIPHYRCGRKGKRGRILIDVDDLTAFLEECRVQPEAVDESDEDLQIIR